LPTHLTCDAALLLELWLALAALVLRRQPPQQSAIIAIRAAMGKVSGKGKGPIYFEPTIL
jgi:hypothetical protein